MVEQIKLKKVFVNLRSLRDNLPDVLDIEEKFVNIFNEEIDKLIELGFDVGEFKIPQKEIERIITGKNHVVGGNIYSDKKYISKGIFLMKLDAILAFFSLLNPETKIGFDVD